MKVAVMLWEPRGNVKSNLIFADQEPSISTELLITVNVSSSPSILKIKLGANVFPWRSIMELPLFEVKVPVTLNDSPAAGLSVILSTVINVGERTVIVDIRVKVLYKVLEPLKYINTSICPNGWSLGIKNVKFTNPWELEVTSFSHVSWNSAETSNPSNAKSSLLDSTNLAPNVTLVPLSTTTLSKGVLSLNVVIPLTKIVSFPVPVR